MKLWMNWMNREDYKLLHKITPMVIKGDKVIIITWLMEMVITMLMEMETILI